MGAVEEMQENGWLLHPKEGLTEFSEEDRPAVWLVVLWMFFVSLILTDGGYCFQERMKQLNKVLKKQQGSKFLMLAAVGATGAAWAYCTVAMILQVLIWLRVKFSCWISINVCALIYASTKLFLYLVFIEKVRLLNLELRFAKADGSKYLYHLSVAPSPQTPSRRKDGVYKTNMFLFCQYAWFALLMLAFQVSKWETSDMFAGSPVACNIGLHVISSVPLICYDAFYTFFLNWQLKLGCQMVTSETMRRVAVRNSQGAMVASCVSLLNILSLAVRNKAGMPSEMCFGFCAIDVFVNIRTVQYVMNPRTGGKRGNRGTTAPMTSYNTTAVGGTGNTIIKTNG